MDLKQIPAMSTKEVHDYLNALGRAWLGKGVAVELGSWFGATATPLLTGLVKANYNLPAYFYDRWQANITEVAKAKRFGVKIKEGQNLLPFFRTNVLTSGIPESLLNFNKGNIWQTLLEWPYGPIEYCIFDAPKRTPIFIRVLKILGPSFIPGVTVLGLLDYTFYLSKTGKKRELFKVQERFINKYHEAFTLIKSWPGDCSCYFFRYEGGLDWSEVDIV